MKEVNESEIIAVGRKLDRRTLKFIYRLILARIIANRGEASESGYDLSKDRAYREVLGMISDILSD